MVKDNADQLTLALPGIGTIIASRITSDAPQLGATVGNVGTITVLDVPIPPSDAKDLHHLVSFGRDAPELLIATLALLLLALAISPRRDKTLIRLALGATVCGLALVAIYLAGRGIVVNEFQTPDGQAVARAAWSTYLGSLETWGFVLAAAGAITAAVAKLTRRMGLAPV